MPACSTARGACLLLPAVPARLLLPAVPACYCPRCLPALLPAVPACYCLRCLPACYCLRYLPACYCMWYLPACYCLRYMPVCYCLRYLPVCYCLRYLPACYCLRYLPACYCLRCLPACPPSRGACRYIDVRTNSGLCALHFAVHSSGPYVDAFKTLLAHDPNIALANTYTADDHWLPMNILTTPLHLAAQKGCTVVATELLKFYVSHSPRTAPECEKCPRPLHKAHTPNMTPHWGFRVNHENPNMTPHWGFRVNHENPNTKTLT